MSEIHVGDIGTIIRIRFIDEDTGDVVDISDATTKRIKFVKTNGVPVTKTADFTTDGTDGYIEYVTIAGDLSIHGSWQKQGYASGLTFTNNTEIERFEVEKNL